MRHLHRSDLFHAFLACFLFLKELAFARNIAAVALGEHVFAQGFDCLTRNHIGANSRLDGHVVHLAGNHLAHFAHHRPAPVGRLGAVHDDGQRVHPLAIEQNIHLDHIGWAVFLELVVHGRIAPADGFELVKKQCPGVSGFVIHGFNCKKFFLAIGIDDYADVPDVPFADRSAKLFAEMARKTLGAQPENIITLTNQEATSGRLRGRLRTLLGRLTPEDRLLIYFAGHGVPAQDGKNVFLLAQDGGSGSFEEPDLQLNALYAQVDRSRVGQAQLFIDACFSGRSNKDSMILGGTAGVAIVPKHGIRSDSRLTVMIAGRAEQLSNQHEERGHRLFGYHLMHAMLNDGLKLSAGEIHSQGGIYAWFYQTGRLPDFSRIVFRWRL